MSLLDLAILNEADADHQASLRGLVRTGRRIVNRCWRDNECIQRPRVFCQNSGGCGSTYIVRLLEANGINNVFHEKTPDLNRVGLEHFERPIAKGRLIRLIRYTRHDAYFEANNRLFSLGQELAAAFPNAHFIHLHRDGTEAVRSAMSKPDLDQYLATNIRFAGSLAGNRSMSAFERFCHYWANMNRRIHEDLRIARTHGHRVINLKFEELIDGRIESVESLLAMNLTKSTCNPANRGRVGSKGKFPAYSAWAADQKATFEAVCGPVMASLGR